MKETYKFHTKLLSLLAVIVLCCATFNANAQNPHDRYLVAHESDSLAILGEFHWLQDAVNFVDIQPNKTDKYFIWATENDDDMSDSENNGDGTTFPVLVDGKDLHVTIYQGLNIKLSSWEVTDAEYAFTIIQQQSDARHIVIRIGAELTLENIILDGNFTYGGIMNLGTLIMNTGAVVQNCKNGGVINDSMGTFTMNDGASIMNNTGNGGGGVDNAGNFTMTGGTISGNSCIGGDMSGGVHTYSYASFHIPFGSTALITNNEAYLGGGVGVERGGSFLMEGGTITLNRATMGGGVWNIGAFTMTGGTISDNTAALAGGVGASGISWEGDFILNGGTITRNTANEAYGDPTFMAMYQEDNDMYEDFYAFGCGGGVWVLYFESEDEESLMTKSGSFTMNSGTISGNTATRDGGGIYTRNYNYTTPNHSNAYNNITITGGTIDDTNFAGGGTFGPYVGAWSKGFPASLLTNNQINYRGTNATTEYICPGDSIILEAIVVTEPDVEYYYQWYVNKIKIDGATQDTYTYYPKDMDSAYCVVKSNQPCSDSIITNIITIKVKTRPLPPTVESLYETCLQSGTLTLDDLVAIIPINYTDIDWYAEKALLTLLDPAITTLTLDTPTYWLVRTEDGCQSKPSYLTVIINNNLNVPPPVVPNPIELCNTQAGTLFLSDLETLIANPNLLWFRDMAGSLPINPSDPVSNIDTIYYVGQKIGDCQSTTLVPINIKYADEYNTKPMDSAFYFCDGATIKDLNVKFAYPLTLNWFTSTTPDATPLGDSYVLEDGETYYAQIAYDGTCANYQFAEVEITIGGTPPEATELEFCSGKPLTLMPEIGGYGLDWYFDKAMTKPAGITDKMLADTTYYGFNTTGSCAYLAYEITTNLCFTLYGTVFPFVQEFVGGVANKEFNDLFTVTARLYPVPTVAHGANPIKALMQLSPIHTTTAFYYNGTIHVPGTPSNPGAIGVRGNPGKAINWEPVVGDYIPAPVDYDEVKPNFAPIAPVGIYRFNDVKAGDYVLMLSAPGLTYRYGVINIYTNADTLLGHRELIPGDINCDALIDHRDLGIVNGMYSNYTDPPVNRYNLMFDLNKDGKVDVLDSQLIITKYGGFSSMFYQETWDWLFSY